MSPVSIRPATGNDASAIVRIHYDALDEFHEFYAAFFAMHPRDMLPLSTTAALKKPSENFIVAVDDESAAIVGFARYVVEDPSSKPPTAAAAAAATDSHSTQESDTAQPNASLFAPKEHLKDLWDRFNEADDEKDACHEKTVGDQRHIYVKHVMVDPAHQRRGIGGKLLGSITARSDEEGLPTYIISSAAANHLYGKLGFETLVSWEIDSAYWLGELVKRQRDVGLEEEDAELLRQFEGKKECDSAMVRWPSTRRRRG